SREYDGRPATGGDSIDGIFGSGRDHDASPLKRQLFFPKQKLFFTGIWYPASGIWHLLLDLRFFFAYDKDGGTGRNFAAEVPTSNWGAGVPAPRILLCAKSAAK
ncbi:hypothetical protein L0152_28365, partial [bacterium]|nr:hypothetical protein [bacterium]